MTSLGMTHGLRPFVPARGMGLRVGVFACQELADIRNHHANRTPSGIMHRQSTELRHIGYESTTNQQPMKESEWPYAIAHSYEFMGKTHHMRMDEAMAIGRSGRSGTIQQYAMEPGQYLHRTGATIAAKVSAMHDRPGATPPTAKDEDVALSIGPKHLTAKDRAEGQAASRELEKVARQREKDGFFIPMMWTEWEKRQLELLERGLDPVTDGDFKRARMRRWLR